MHLFIFASVLLTAAAAANDAIPARTSPSTKDFLRARMLAARLDSVDNLAFCYGDNSICGASNDLHDNCDAFEADKDPTQWYQCLCGNGFVSVREACGWCDTVFGISGDIGDLYSAECTSIGVTIAPIPASIIALESMYNATYTGTMPVGVTLTKGGVAVTGTGSSQSVTRTSSGSASASRTSGSATSRKTSSSLSTTTFTLGGSGSTPTPQATTTQSLLATQSAGAGGTGGAAGLNCGTAMTFSMVFCGLVMAFLL